MIFTISRASDIFRDIRLPDRNCSPHPLATWDNKIGNWIVTISTVEHIRSLLTDNTRLIIDAFHIEIDDMVDGVPDNFFSEMEKQ